MELIYWVLSYIIVFQLGFWIGKKWEALNELESKGWV